MKTTTSGRPLSPPLSPTAYYCPTCRKLVDNATFATGDSALITCTITSHTICDPARGA